MPDPEHNQDVCLSRLFFFFSYHTKCLLRRNLKRERGQRITEDGRKRGEESHALAKEVVDHPSIYQSLYPALVNEAVHLLPTF